MCNVHRCQINELSFLDEADSYGGARLTLLALWWSVSFKTLPLSQFLILRKRGHLEGLPFCSVLVGDVLSEVGP